MAAHLALSPVQQHVRLEKLEPVNPKIRKPMVVDGRGQAPPQYPNFD
jgi:hypothetical protein